MSNSSFQYWEHREKVRRIAKVDDGLITGVEWANDVFINLPTAGSLILQYHVPNNQALVITRFEAYMYNPGVAFPVECVFDNGMVLQFVTSSLLSGLNPNQTRFAGLGNVIANTDAIFFFNSGETAQLNAIDPLGPKPIQLVALCYAWLIPGGTAGNFENYKTLQASV